MTTAEENASKRILVVDDDESVLSFLSFSLKSEGFQVESAKDAEAALRHINIATPNLILLDIMLPKMDGFAMCKHVRTNLKLTHIPILFITAYADPSSLKKASDAGAQGLIEKPILFDEILMQVYDALNGHFSLPTRLKFAA